MKIKPVYNKAKQQFLLEHGIKPISADTYLETPKLTALLDQFNIYWCFYHNNIQRRR